MICIVQSDIVPTAQYYAVDSVGNRPDAASFRRASDQSVESCSIHGSIGRGICSCAFSDRIQNIAQNTPDLTHLLCGSRISALLQALRLRLQLGIYVKITQQMIGRGTDRLCRTGKSVGKRVQYRSDLRPGLVCHGQHFPAPVADRLRISVRVHVPPVRIAKSPAAPNLPCLRILFQRVTGVRRDPRKSRLCAGNHIFAFPTSCHNSRRRKQKPHGRLHHRCFFSGEIDGDSKTGKNRIRDAPTCLYIGGNHCNFPVRCARLYKLLDHAAGGICFVVDVFAAKNLHVLRRSLIRLRRMIPQAARQNPQRAGNLAGNLPGLYLSAADGTQSGHVMDELSDVLQVHLSTGALFQGAGKGHGKVLRLAENLLRDPLFPRRKSIKGIYIHITAPKEIVPFQGPYQGIGDLQRIVISGMKQDIISGKDCRKIPQFFCQSLVFSFCIQLPGTIFQHRRRDRIGLQFTDRSQKQRDISILPISSPVYVQTAPKCGQCIPHDKRLFCICNVAFCHTAKSAKNAVRKTGEADDLCLKHGTGRQGLRTPAVPCEHLLLRYDQNHTTTLLQGAAHPLQHIFAFFPRPQPEHKFRHGRPSFCTYFIIQYIVHRINCPGRLGQIFRYILQKTTLYAILLFRITKSGD